LPCLFSSFDLSACLPPTSHDSTLSRSNRHISACPAAAIRNTAQYSSLRCIRFPISGLSHTPTMATIDSFISHSFVGLELPAHNPETLAEKTTPVASSMTRHEDLVGKEQCTRVWKANRLQLLKSLVILGEGIFSVGTGSVCFRLKI